MGREGGGGGGGGGGGRSNRPSRSFLGSLRRSLDSGSKTATFSLMGGRLEQGELAERRKHIIRRQRRFDIYSHNETERRERAKLS